MLHIVVSALALSPGSRPPAPKVPSVSAVRPALSIPAAATAAALVSVPLPSFAASAVETFIQSNEVKQLGIYFVQTVISWGVPAAVVLFVVAAAGGRRGDREDDELPAPLARALGMLKEPKEFLKIELLNNKLQSFDYSFDKATISKESALRASREVSFRRVWAAELSNLGLNSKQLEAIGKATERYRKAQKTLMRQLEKNQRMLRAATVAQRLDSRVFDAIMVRAGQGRSKKKMAAWAERDGSPWRACAGQGGGLYLSGGGGAGFVLHARAGQNRMSRRRGARAAFACVCEDEAVSLQPPSPLPSLTPLPLPPVQEAEGGEVLEEPPATGPRAASPSLLHPLTLPLTPTSHPSFRKRRAARFWRSPPPTGPRAASPSPSPCLSSARATPPPTHPPPATAKVEA
jgi:hypothetical protein